MKFSAQEEYGLRCLLAIAGAGPSGSITIGEIGRQEGISTPHAAKLLSILRRHGHIRSTRGQAGGYALCRPAEEISVGKVLADLGGRLYDDGFCQRHSGTQSSCTHLVSCSLPSLWSKIQTAVDGALAGVSLADLMVSDAEAAHLKELAERSKARASLAPLPVKV